MRTRLLPLLASLLLVARCLANPVQINYPVLPTKGDPQLAYMLALLRLACDKAGEQCQLYSGPAMVQGRAIQEMQRPQGQIDVMWTMTSAEREQRLLPVRIPLYKGLIGWRVALLRPDRSELLAKIDSAAALAKLTAGQEHDWPDTAILQHTGLPVVTTPDYEPLFSMLLQRRFDYFPRSVIEVINEQRTHADLGLVIDRHILLRYPAAFYFFVRPQRPELARMLTRGLEKAVRDGSFDALFQQHHGPALRALRLDKRRIIDLSNPLLPPTTPLQRKELWYRP